MGDHVDGQGFSRAERTRFRGKVQRCLDALTRMLAEDRFRVDSPRIGMEIELNLVDTRMAPAMANAEVLGAIADDAFQTELGRFNIERSEEHTSELQSRFDLVCRLLLEKKKATGTKLRA